MSEQKPSISVIETVLYEGKDIRVRFSNHGPEAFHPETLFVTFTPRQNDRPEGFGEAFFDKLKVNAVYVISKWNHWWNTAEYEQALKSVAAYAEKAAPSRLIAYGSSMGGLGALLSARYLDVTETLAFCPQYSMDTRIVPFEKRWKVYTNGIQFMPDSMPYIPAKGRTIVFVDTFHAGDRAHYNMIKSIRPVTLVPVNLSGHDVAGRLNKYGLLSSILTEIVSAPTDFRDIRRNIREARRNSPHYWSVLGAWALQTGRIPLAKIAASQVVPAVSGIAYPKKSAEIFDFLSNFYLNRNQPLKSQYYKSKLM